MKIPGPMSRRVGRSSPWIRLLERIHHQVATAIAHDMGGDDFVREKKALHFGIRKRCVPFNDCEEAEEPSGVVDTISRSNLLAEQGDR
jgi:hypothetical protein